MKNLLALGLVCALPAGLAAEDPGTSEASLGTVTVIVLDEALPARCAKDTDCMAVNRAVLTARTQKVSVLRERGRWI